MCLEIVSLDAWWLQWWVLIASIVIGYLLGISAARPFWSYLRGTRR